MTVKKKILIADDDQRNRVLLETLLRFEGYEVHSAESGQAALDALATEPADLVLLDLMMPGMDGFEVVRRLKADPATRRIPVMVVTALDDASSQARLAGAGVAETLAKPLNRWELKMRVQKLLGGAP
jgi:CheY-like chemotaxis protein